MENDMRCQRRSISIFSICSFTQYMESMLLETVQPCYYRGTERRRDANRYLGRHKSISATPRPDVVIAAFVRRL